MFYDSHRSDGGKTDMQKRICLYIEEGDMVSFTWVLEKQFVKKMD